MKNPEDFDNWNLQVNFKLKGVNKFLLSYHIYLNYINIMITGQNEQLECHTVWISILITYLLLLADNIIMYFWALQIKYGTP